MNRLFVALKIPAEVRKMIAEFPSTVIKDFSKFRWEPEEKIHLTLKFIGDTDDAAAGGIAGALDFVREYKSFKCGLTKFGFFHKSGQPKILWLGLSVEDRLPELARRINIELERFSVPADTRQFKAHLTLRRLKGNEGPEFVKKFEEFKIPEIEFHADEIALIKSDLLPSGSKYTELKTYKLK